jgi:hypothetical protein
VCLQKYNEMDTFARIISASAQKSDYAKIAAYYETRGEEIKVRQGGWPSSLPVMSFVD